VPPLFRVIAISGLAITFVKHKIAVGILTCVLAAFSNLLHSQTVVSAPAPAGEPLSTAFQVTVQQTNVPVYLARVCSLAPEQRASMQKTSISQTATTSFASFDMSGPVQVTVDCSDDVTSAKLLPSSYGLTPQVDGKKVTFQVNKPGQVTLEINGNWISSLHLFANPMETDIPDPHDPNVIYFGPGIHNVEGIVVGSGKTVYLAGGAIIYGHSVKGTPWGAVMKLDGSNIVLRGRGIIDGSLCPEHWPTFSGTGQNIRVEGIIVRDSCEFSLPFRQSQFIKIDNVKIFGWRGNSDGIDIINSQQVQISHCFIRTFDDLISLKAESGRGELQNVSASHCVFWNELAHAIAVGDELFDPLTNMSFTDCDVIHDKGRENLIRISDIECGTVTNAVFDHIRIEEGRRPLAIELGINGWSKQTVPGHVNNVMFSNITSTTPVLPGPFARVVGFDDTHKVNNVAFENVVVAGKPLTSAEVQQNAFVHNVTITP
jgi:hypothetical protein